MHATVLTTLMVGIVRQKITAQPHTELAVIFYNTRFRANRLSVVLLPHHYCTVNMKKVKIPKHKQQTPPRLVLFRQECATRRVFFCSKKSPHRALACLTSDTEKKMELILENVDEFSIDAAHDL